MLVEGVLKVVLTRDTWIARGRFWTNQNLREGDSLVLLLSRAILIGLGAAKYYDLVSLAPLPSMPPVPLLPCRVQTPRFLTSPYTCRKCPENR